MLFIIYDIIIMNRYSLAFSVYATMCLILTAYSLTNCSQCDLDTVQMHIDRLQNKNAILQALRQSNAQNEHIDIQIQQKAIKQGSQQSLSNIKYVSFQNLDISKQMSVYCQMKIGQKSSHFLFQTPRASYVVVNNFKQSYFAIYTHDCHLYAKIMNFTVKQLYCDRGLCDDGNVVLLTHQMNLIGCSQVTNFTTCSPFATLSNVIKGEPVGGLVRNKGSGNCEIYIADSAGQIIALDGQGKLRMTIPMERKNNITHFVDIHPNPIIITKRGWIYTFQNNKYTISLTKCPYLFHQISSVVVSHPYSPTIYAISSTTISKIQFKSQPKTCQVLNKFHFSQRISQANLNVKKYGQFQGQIYIDNQIVNIKQQSVRYLQDCGSQAEFNFQMMKNNYRKGFFSLKCCQNVSNKDECRIILFRNKVQEQGSAKNNTVIMIILLFLIILLVFYFLRTTAPNLDYDEELKYDHNLRYKNEVQQFLKTRAQTKSTKVGKNENQNNHSRFKQQESDQR